MSSDSFRRPVIIRTRSRLGASPILSIPSAKGQIAERRIGVGMDHAISVRPASEDDLEAINQIYNLYVPVSSCTMEMEPVSMDARRRWFLDHNERYPALVAEAMGEVVGWASLSPYRPRAAYRPTVEDAVYVHPDWRGKGVGEVLLDELIVRARELNYHNIMAVINASHEVSLSLHHKKGFREVGHLPQVANKFGTWVDIKMLMRRL